ncbi:MAG TPA: neutral zinc metallopeptidase [Candidatus Dormibacteraeota bacterium]|nr:neutral zinc metallopeptidase [Candidatus Dormibacteraeota bacterium]
MTFDPGARLDPSQVEDVRGSGRFGGGFGRMGGTPVIVGGGGLGLILTIALIVLNSGILGGSGFSNVTGAGGPESSALASCQTGADANARDDCRIVGFVDSVQTFWKQELQRSGQTYASATTVLFTAQADTGCGPATTAVGPFYCPNDGHVYLDLGFFNELRTQLGATGGPLAEGYVVGHEYGHHIQDLLGQLSPGGSTGANSQAVKTELQADCYAGVWIDNAASTGLLQPPTDAQIADALNAAQSVGDDRIQQETQGQVNPETWTHGSSAQRQHWLTVGMQTGDPSACTP